MNNCVKDAEVLADEVGYHPLTEAERARIDSAARRILNQLADE